MTSVGARVVGHPAVLGNPRSVSEKSDAAATFSRDVVALAAELAQRTLANMAVVR